MLESGSSGSVRGASSNGRPYREPPPNCDVHGREPLRPLNVDIVEKVGN
jgi:hypothetical protein